MADLDLPDDPSYRAGLLIGRKRASTDVLELLLDPATGSADDKLVEIVAWCLQAQEECAAELPLVVADLEGG